MGKVTHGMTPRNGSYHELYGIWCAMRQRCQRATHPAFRRYGGRGITICERWDDFSAFIADMGPRPSGFTIERINNDGPYSPDNCKWATRQEQQANKAPAFTYVVGEAAACSKERSRQALQRSNAQRRNPPKTCQQCGQPYIRQGYKAVKRRPKFCSRQCYYTSRIGNHYK